MARLARPGIEALATRRQAPQDGFGVVVERLLAVRRAQVKGVPGVHRGVLRRTVHAQTADGTPVHDAIGLAVGQVGGSQHGRSNRRRCFFPPHETTKATHSSTSTTRMTPPLPDGPARFELIRPPRPARCMPVY